jgi:7-alpha-hydroxysteroid dehydrogenase
VAIVTGAGKGISRACALALAQAGADVALAARNQTDLDAVAAEIRALGRRAITVTGNMGEEAALDTLVARKLDELGKISILINNSGGAGLYSPLKMSGDDFTAVLAWNVTPAYLLIQKTFSAMNEAGPWRGLGSPRTLQAAALFLVSPASSWITGKILGVDVGVEAPNF